MVYWAEDLTHATMLRSSKSSAFLPTQRNPKTFYEIVCIWQVKCHLSEGGYSHFAKAQQGFTKEQAESARYNLYFYTNSNTQDTQGGRL